MTVSSSSSALTLARAPRSWVSRTSFSLPASRSSRVSPTQRMGLSSEAWAAMTFLLIEVVGLAENLAAFAVADDDVLDEQLARLRVALISPV